MEPTQAAATQLALRVRVGGRVQGVGFRPYVFRLASRFGLPGAVRNDGDSVEIEVQGAPAALRAFLEALQSEAPPMARPQIVDVQPLATSSERNDFRILASTAAGPGAGLLAPDQSVCAQCLAEMLDKADRRWQHPFINCTQCGPRYTVIDALPYDRVRTSMAGFELCADCRKEYEDPVHRRFHAEPLCCPACGPQLRFEATAGGAPAMRAAALAACIASLRAGGIVAVKAVGGYHLMCDARSTTAVARLRARKHRPDKPLAVLFAVAGSDGLEDLAQEVVLEPQEREALLDAARPIVLVRRRAGGSLAAIVAPGLDELGVMLPSSPLQVLLTRAFAGPLVATSGNLSGEPVFTDDAQARERLAGLTDAILLHDRPILRPADDPVVRVLQGRARPVRLGRGTAPLQLSLQHHLDHAVLAAGGDMKNTVALAFSDRVVISPHIGDLRTPRARDVHGQVAHDLQRLLGVPASCVIADCHPNYASSAWARGTGLPLVEVLHHHAHASALAGEWPDVAQWLVFAWDGVGAGENGDLWGGETLCGSAGRWHRRGSWRRFRPPGGDRAAREPWRSAAALCWEAGRHLPRQTDGMRLAHAAWTAGINCPATSAVGRLFDAAAYLLLGLEATSYEAQGAMRVEALAAQADGGSAIALPLATGEDGVVRIDWEPLTGLLCDEGRAAARRAADFHATLAHAALRQALAIRERVPFDAIGLTGGVFQNRVLCRHMVDAFAKEGVDVHIGLQVPANDAGLSFGQIVEYAAAQARRPSEAPGALAAGGGRNDSRIEPKAYGR